MEMFSERLFYKINRSYSEPKITPFGVTLGPEQLHLEENWLLEINCALTLVNVWENSKRPWKSLPAARVSTAFLVLLSRSRSRSRSRSQGPSDLVKIENRSRNESERFHFLPIPLMTPTRMTLVKTR